MSAAIGFVLLNPGKHPIKFAGSDFPAAKLTYTGEIHFKRRTTVGAIQLRPLRQWLRVSVSYERPILTPAAQAVLRSADDIAGLVHSIVVTLRPDTYRDRVVKSVLFDFHRLDGIDYTPVQGIT